MSTQPLYCHNCNEHYNVRSEDIELMRRHYDDFDEKGYRGGCFFKNLGRLKRSLNQREENDHRRKCK